MKLFLAFTLLTLMLTGGAFAAEQGLTDQKFVKMVAQGNLTEMNKGKVAQEKAQAEDIRQYATRMAEEHGKIYDRLKTIAKQNNMDIPTEMDQEHQKKIEDLRNIPADQFDRQYLQMMVKDHAKGVQRFQQSIGKLQNQDLKNWAEQTLVILQDHLQRAKDLAQQRGIEVEKIAEKGRQEAKKGK